IAALEPQSVYYSTFVRFYSTAQFCVLLGAFAFERALARAYSYEGAVSARPVRSWVMGAALWGLVLVLCLALALSLQVLSGCLVLGILVFALVRVGWVGSKRGLKDALRAPEAFVVYAIAAASLGVAVVAPGFARYAWKAVTTVEVWNRRESLAPLYYV